eukprot:6181389-Amphidinium_carterae.1
MEIKTTFKQMTKRLTTDKGDYRIKRFHDFSIITMGLDYNADYAAMMIKYYYSDERKQSHRHHPPDDTTYYS